MPKKRARRRSFIRRKRAVPKQEAAVPVAKETREEKSEGAGDWGFISGFRAGDFVQSEVEGDFVRDNEVTVSDEIFEEFEKVFGSNEQLSGQAKAAADGLGKAVGMIESL